MSNLQEAVTVAEANLERVIEKHVDGEATVDDVREAQERVESARVAAARRVRDEAHRRRLQELIDTEGRRIRERRGALAQVGEARARMNRVRENFAALLVANERVGALVNEILHEVDSLALPTDAGREAADRQRTRLRYFVKLAAGNDLFHKGAAEVLQEFASVGSAAANWHRGDAVLLDQLESLLTGFTRRVDRLEAELSQGGSDG